MLASDWRSSKVISTAILFGFAAFNFSWMAWNYRRVWNDSFATQVNPQGLSVRRRPIVSWSRVDHPVEVEEFGLWGQSKGVWFRFEDTQGNQLARVRKGIWAPEDEDRFLSVIARYLKPTQTP